VIKGGILMAKFLSSSHKSIDKYHDACQPIYWHNSQNQKNSILKPLLSQECDDISSSNHLRTQQNLSVILLNFLIAPMALCSFALLNDIPLIETYRS
jgi:hypothetical protein